MIARPSAVAFEPSRPLAIAQHVPRADDVGKDGRPIMKNQCQWISGFLLRGSADRVVGKVVQHFADVDRVVL